MFPLFPKTPVMTLVDEPLIHATTYIPLMDNADQNLAGEKREAADLVKQDGIGALQKSNSKKLKNETDKGTAVEDMAGPREACGVVLQSVETRSVRRELRFPFHHVSLLHG